MEEYVSLAVYIEMELTINSTVFSTNKTESEAVEDLLVEFLTSALGDTVRSIRPQMVMEMRAIFKVWTLVYLDSEVFFSQLSDTLQPKSANELLQNMITARLGEFSDLFSLKGDLIFRDWFVQAHGVCIPSTTSTLKSTSGILVAVLFISALHESVLS
ncbi:hypothetical protein P879_03799 [Paragonimus westermani]|uniref:Uncharacterized protein n=1 Tax=Paragonimus westermani TaxID=34504 RepID=A0A8T0DW34_9TREM|nr:hypothetical protein P879_03799 [Paragonimus westermani]